MKARDLIMQADGIASKQGLNQTQWSRAAGHAKNGQTVSRMISKGDCRMSTFIRLLEPLGARLKIEEEQDERQGE